MWNHDSTGNKLKNKIQLDALGLQNTAYAKTSSNP